MEAVPFVPTRQIVILVGGKGTRLGALSKQTPKPLMPVGEDKVFLDYVLEACLRQGFAHVLLIAGHLGEQVQERYAHRRIADAEIDVIVEPCPMGTGGALTHVQAHLADKFFLMNGDTLFDINMRALEQRLAANVDCLATMALRRVADVGRYGSVDIDEDGMIRQFNEKDASKQGVEGLVNGGIYLLRRDAIGTFPSGPCSIENDVFPSLIAQGALAGVVNDGYFLDIGLPETLQISREDLPRRKRPVLFLDRDGVLNVDRGYVSSIDDWEWIPGARDLIRAANDAGVAVIVVTNQAGVGRGYYSEPTVWALHHQVQAQLMQTGAFVDAFYYCPDHPEALQGAYCIPHPLGRKPDPGMLARAARQHGLDLSRALLVGDQPTDLAAAQALAVPALQFAGGRLDNFVLESREWARLVA